jgi:hypothetical protein
MDSIIIICNLKIKYLIMMQYIETTIKINSHSISLPFLCFIMLVFHNITLDTSHSSRPVHHSHSYYVWYGISYLMTIFSSNKWRDSKAAIHNWFNPLNGGLLSLWCCFFIKVLDWIFYYLSN